MDPMIKLAASALPGEKKYILFAGAGVSKDAGVPTAWDLMLKTVSLLYAAENKEESDSDIENVDLERWFLDSKYADYTYSKLIGELYPKTPDQRHFLEQYLSGYEAGDAHFGIAELARREIIRAVITTNFDHYIEDALHQIGLRTQIISNNEDLRNSEPLIHCKAVRIYKPHGDLDRGALKNTPQDLKKLSGKMESHLVQVLSEHGVIVLGYSGQDEGIQHVFRRRKYTYYPLFWVNLIPPKGKIKNILINKDYNYLKCDGASPFIDNYMRLLNRLDTIAPGVGKGPAISDLRVKLGTPNVPVVPVYLEILDNIFNDLETIRPDFTKFNNTDEAILEQIHAGIPIVSRFIEATSLICQYSNFDSLQECYTYFGKLMKYQDLPENFEGTFKKVHFDGYLFIVYEMFVCFVALLIKYGHWKLLGELLNDELFVENKRYGSKYRHFTEISQPVNSLDKYRSERLKLNNKPVMSDEIKERYSRSELTELIKHKEFMEADYFLFMKTVTTEDLTYLSKVWCPRSCVWMEEPPTYIYKSENIGFLKELAGAIGFDDEQAFIDKLKNTHRLFGKFFKGGWEDSPLDYFDLEKLGSRT